MSRISFKGRTIAATLAIAAFATAAFVAPSFGGDGVPGTFDPDVTFQTSTTRATAHPDLRITIDNTGNTAGIGAVQQSLPNGFWGSLASVTTQCETLDFPAGNGDTHSGCTAASKIGTVTTQATIDDSEATLTGDVYIIKSDLGDLAAYIGIEVHAKVDGVDLGYIRVRGQAKTRPDVLGNPAGIDATFEDVPQSITQTVGPDSRTVNFHIDKLTVDLVSDIGGANPPLLTNPSSCDTSPAVITVWPGPIGDGNEVVSSIDYTPTDCADQKLAPSTFNFGLSVPTAASATGFTSEIDFPDNSPSIKTLKMKLPGHLGLRFPSFGTSADMCPTSSVPALVQNGDPLSFDPTNCPLQAIIGKVKVTTPLVNEVLVGDLYLIDNNPNPWLGIAINPYVDTGGDVNPNGLVINLVAATTVTQRDSACSSPPCQQEVRIAVQDMPDAPITKIEIDGDRADRTGAGNVTLSGKTLTVASAGSCQPADETLIDFTSHSGATAARASTQAISGCTADPIQIGGSEVGAETTTDTTPSFNITAGGSPGPNFFCAIDHFALSNLGTACAANTTYTPASALALGSHRVYAGTVANGTGSNTTRGIAVVEAPTSPGPAPAASFTTAPPATTGVTPSFAFDSTQPGYFQCSLDDGSFLPCSDTGSTATSGSYAVDSDDSLQPGSTHKFEVRVQNAEGTLSPVISSGNFDVKVAFNPLFAVTPSTNVVRAHPSLDVSITNGSDEKFKDVKISLPDGFFGGLQGAQTLCSQDSAAAGTCPASSKIGTIDTEASVDNADANVRLAGEVFLTDPATGTSDPAGISIKVHAKLQEVDLGNIVVPVRLIVRDQAKGIDSMVVGVPTSITPATNPYGDTITHFNLRKLDLHLNTGAGAAQPLFTNPSSCRTGAFELTSSSTASPSSSGSDSVPFTAAGCPTLGFAPTLAATFIRSDGKIIADEGKQHINLSATLNASPGEAGISQASLLLPKPITIDVNMLPPRYCEQTEAELGICPASTLVGNAVATSPLLRTGETLAGDVYLVRAKPPKTLPRLFVGLRGRINLNLYGVNSFENGTQIRSVFDDLPDAPINSFSINVNNYLTSMPKPCEEAKSVGSKMTGTLTGYNGKTSAVNQNVPIDCDGVYASWSLKKSTKPTLKLRVEARGTQPKFKKLKLTFSKGIKLNKKLLAKKLTLKGDKKKLKSKCFRYSKPNVLEIGLCGKKYLAIDAAFIKGALIGAKKIKKPTLKIQATPASGKASTFKLDLSQEITPPVPVG